MYLAAKKKDSKGGLSRTKLLDYCRRGKRWSFLTGPSPISVFVFSPAADTIVYSLAAHVWHGNPELVRVLIEVGQYAGLAPSSMTRGVPRIEDVVVRTNKAFGPLLCNIP
ncbi:uncharacterized protein PAC_02782 [Phialocephala subalpina]|uniref:Uncharacterized protein n=1 Tax=Phialocephala subalpina TaxID=576137 RepID=A0A1L7WJF1_9HELO|nr:uncharacterized protein PAC_02782 [Phialocephala subalpina]